MTDDDMVQIPGGTFRMGSDTHYPDEGPSHCHQRRVRGLCRGHRLRDLRRTAAGPRTLSGRATRSADTQQCGVPHAAPSGATARPARLVELRARRQLAPTGGTRQHDRQPGGRTGRACRVRRCGRLRRMGRQGPAHGSGVGVCRPGRAGWGRLLLGRRLHAGRALDGQHLAGRIALAEPHTGRICQPRAGGPPFQPTATGFFDNGR